MDNNKSTSTKTDRDAAFNSRPDAAGRQAGFGTQPDETGQQGRAPQQDEASAATAQALMDCYNG